MTEIMQQEILKRLDLIGAKLGEGAEFAWQAYMRQALLVDGWGQVAFALLLAVLAGGLIRLAFWVCRPVPKSTDGTECQRHNCYGREYAVEDEMARGFGVAAAALLAIITSTTATITLWDGIQHIMNPEYYALMDLARMLGK